MPNKRSKRSIPNSIIHKRWEELARLENISPKARDYRSHRIDFICLQLVTEFSRIFGKDAKNLGGWQKICTTVLGDENRVKELDNIKKCKEALKHKFVNIFDLVDAGIEERSVPAGLVFRKRETLTEYILDTGKVFLKPYAKSNRLLEHFLIVLVVRERKPKQKPETRVNSVDR
ncbi:hypothetical protein VKT23_007907 [Stygiomarasmius scandens]|uniref:Uncharacterized protein n=1 Tax=Marasmiellus scandens TaxID=2682957 RepID=A0ABR1JP73_9AGAR